MIRVLHVVGKMHYGGMETLIMNIYRNIDREKVQFDFMVHYEEPGEYDEEIKSLGGRIFVMPKTVPQNYFKCKKAYEEFFKENHNYVKVHVHLHSMAFLIFPQAKKYDISCVIHIHSNGMEKTLKGYLGLYCTKLAVPMADTVFTCSKEAASFFMPSKYVNKHKIIKNGISVEKFLYNPEIRERIRKENGLDGKFVLLCAARFAVPKNHEFLIDIVYELQKYDENIKLLLVGKGPLEEKIRQKVRSLNLEEKVEFLGARGDVNQLMQASDCYIMPSLWEGLPVVLIEAQTSGLKAYISKEALSDEARITNLVESISLSVSADKWAEKIYLQKEYKRENQNKALRESGFDIRETAKYLQEFYEEL